MMPGALSPIGWLLPHAPARAVFAATGAYHRAFERALGGQCLPSQGQSLPSPALRRSGRQAGKNRQGRRGHARALRRGAEPPVRPMADAVRDQMKELRSARNALIKDRAAAKNHAQNLAGLARDVSAIALLILDGAGWHDSLLLAVPDNIVRLPLPPYAPELNPTENIWEYPRGNWLGHCVWDSHEATSTPVAAPGMP
jgi:hypothetical protein